MIRYHGTAINPDSAAIEVFKRGHAMVSFFDKDQLHLAFEKAQGVALDNGAYALWQRGEGAIDVPAYVDWVDHWRRHPTFEWAIIPDIVDGGEEDNDELIRGWPLARAISAPVWHLHESLEKLERLVNNWPRVAIGSSGQYSRPGLGQWWARIAEAMEIACDADGMPRTKLHGLRQMDPEIFSVIPYHSVDSTRVGRAVGFDRDWSGTYVPPSRHVRALCVQDVLNNHASARRWNHAGIQRNLELLG